MGGKPGQVNSGQANQANAAAGASEQASANLSNENLREQTQNYNYLFGENGKGGSITPFMDPNSLNVSKPTGAYAAQYNNASNTLAQNYAGQKGALAQSWANRGASNGMPSGFQADQERKLGQSEADARGSLFASTVGQQYQDALSNFWNANNVASGQAAGARTGAIQAAGDQGQTASSMYSTSGRQAQTGTGPGTILGAAALCPARGAKITTKRGVQVAVEYLKVGDEILQMNGKYSKLKKLPEPAQAYIYAVITCRGRRTLVSETHCFVVPHGGYVVAKDAKMQCVSVAGQTDLVESVTPIAIGEVFILEVGGNHTYLCDDIWSLD